jgi:hypothetical protein
LAGVVFYLIALRVPTRGEKANLDPGPLGSTALDAPA